MVMMRAEQPINQEGIQDVRVPEFARIAGKFIATVETSPNPVCIDEFLIQTLVRRKFYVTHWIKLRNLAKDIKAFLI